MNKSSLWRTQCKTCQAETLHSAWHCVHCQTPKCTWQKLHLGQSASIALTGKKPKPKGSNYRVSA